jgi:hypothetical protein
MLKDAYRLTQENKLKRASLIYMELAETGLSTAMLNLGMLLDKYDIFENEKTYLAADVDHSQKSFNINKYLAFNYFKTAVNHPDT